MWDKKWVWILIGVLLTLILKGCFDSEIYWPNVKSTHRHQRERASKREWRFVLRVTLTTRRLVAVAVSRLVEQSRFAAIPFRGY